MDPIRDFFASSDLYRSRDRSLLGGVFAGLGRRVGLQPWPARLVFTLVLLLLPGSQLLVYPILWVLMPRDTRTHANATTWQPVSSAYTPGLMVLGAPLQAEASSLMGFSRAGLGEPMILLHGLGSSRAVWDPIVPPLAERFDVIAVDLPGFGTSPPLPRGVEPTPAALAAAMNDLLDALGIKEPHLVGNSLGGWVAVEMAKSRATRSLTLISPAGLWARDTPLYCRASLRLSRGLARHARPVLSRLVADRPGRFLVFGQMYGRPGELSPAQARGAIQAMGQCPGFDATLRATTRRRLNDAQHLTSLVTLAFGSRDVVLLKHQSRHLWALPEGTRAIVLPGCGHVPMNDHPSRVIDVILSAASPQSQRALQEIR